MSPQTSRGLLAILRRSLLWGLGIGGLVFGVAFVAPLLLLGDPGNQSPFLAFFVGPAAFFLGWLLGLLVQAPRVLTISGRAQLIYLVLVVLLVAGPVWRTAPWVAQFVIGLSAVADVPGREERMEFAQQLTDAERVLLSAIHFDLTVAVTNPYYPPVYRRSLIRDLEETGLFGAVASVNETSDADLVATVIGVYNDDRTGKSFTLALNDDPESGLTIKVYYYLGGLLRNPGDRRQYMDRLAVEVIEAVNQLMERQADAPQ